MDSTYGAGGSAIPLSEANVRNATRLN